MPSPRAVERCDEQRHPRRTANAIVAENQSRKRQKTAQREGIERQPVVLERPSPKGIMSAGQDCRVCSRSVNVTLSKMRIDRLQLASIRGALDGRGLSEHPSAAMPVNMLAGIIERTISTIG